MASANSHRGEVAFTVGGVKAIAVLEMERLARLSDAMGNPPLGEIFRRLQVAEPRALVAFVEHLTIDTDADAVIAAMITIEAIAEVQSAAFRAFEPFAATKADSKNG